MAPEIIQNIGYSHAADWYALGILIYELIYGRPPYMDNDPMKVFEMILRERIRFTKTFDPAAKSLIKHLTEPNVAMRYGHISGGVQKIKNHAFFAEIDWLSLSAKDFGPNGMKVPYLPPEKLEDATLENKYKMSYKDLEEYQDN